MNKGSGRLQVFFEDPFWIGVFERMIDEQLFVCKVTFGAEPKDCEVLEFLLEHYDQLRFSPPVPAEEVSQKRRNPKRTQREVKKQLEEVSIGTKSQIALKLLQEQGKMERKIRSRQERELEKERQFEQKQQKRKEKHRGR